MSHYLVRLDYKGPHNPFTYRRTVTPNWYRTHTVPKFGLQSSWVTGGCHCRYMPDSFFLIEKTLLEIVLWSKSLYGNLSRYAGIHILKNMVEIFINRRNNKVLTLNFVFTWKIWDRNKINLLLCNYIKEYNSFRIALQLRFIHKLTKNAYIKAPTKTQCTTTKLAFVKNYDDIDDKHNSVPSPEIEVET